MNQDITNRPADDMYFDNLKEGREEDYGEHEDSRFSKISTDIKTITSLFENHQSLHKSAKTDIMTEDDRLWADTFEIGHTGEELLFRPEATINLKGQLEHDDSCPCFDGRLTS